MSLKFSIPRNWINLTWWIWVILLIVYGINLNKEDFFCFSSATDFRGYYASAQIAWSEGFVKIYHQPTQDSYQKKLELHCRNNTATSPAIKVSMPYFPVFVIPLLLLPIFEFHTSFILWVMVNSIILIIYCKYFLNRLKVKTNWLILFQWLVCLPLFANLVLGQVNSLLVICLGEFTYYWIKNKEIKSGAWLAVMLVKPHLLIFLIPGLVIARKWRILIGFLSGSILILGISYFLVSKEGFDGILKIVSQFASQDFQSAAFMMNWRAVALNLQTISFGDIGWTINAITVGLTTILVLFFWYQFYQYTHQFRSSEVFHNIQGPKQNETKSLSSNKNLISTILLVMATYAATLTVTWHSHFYMLILLIPLLTYLDTKKRIQNILLAFWTWVPPLLYFIITKENPIFARAFLGFSYLGLALVIAVWGFYYLRKNLQTFTFHEAT